jgi:hypothetical protein
VRLGVRGVVRRCTLEYASRASLQALLILERHRQIEAAVSVARTRAASAAR